MMGPGARSYAALLARFVLHNAEEITFADRGIGPDPRILARLGLDEADYRADRMAVATTLLTGAVAVAGRPGGRGEAASLVAIGAAGALGVNAMGHLAQAAVRRRYNPGLVTAPCLLLASSVFIVHIARGTWVQKRKVAAAVLVAGVGSVPAIVAPLRLARVLCP